MYDSIFETVVKGSNTVFLDIPDKEYYFSYDEINLNSAQEIAENYFKYRGRDGIPHVEDISFDASTHRVKIEVNVEHDREYKLHPYSVPKIFDLH